MEQGGSKSSGKRKCTDVESSRVDESGDSSASEYASASDYEISNMGSTPTIFLFFYHDGPDMSYSAYSIELPRDISDQLVDSDGFILNSKPISPAFALKEENEFSSHCAAVTFGSKVYFLGGRLEVPRGSSADTERLFCQVRVFDTRHPDQGLLSVAPMHAPKETPCVFVADGFLYALGSTLKSFGNILPGFKGSGVFERYDPISDQWQVLPDPPTPTVCWEDNNFLDKATVVGRQVFIGSSIYLVFNLDSNKWDSFPPSDIAARFPYGSLFVGETNSLYQLTSLYALKLGVQFLGDHHSKEPLTAVKRGPLATIKDSHLLRDPCLDPGKEQVMAQSIDLDEDKRFTRISYCPWRDLFHVGGRFFCYIVTSPLVDEDDLDHYYEPYSRGVLIKFFEEVEAPTNKNDNPKTKFRPLASFCYKIKTNFDSRYLFARCSVLGTVPDSWINAPPQKRQEPQLKNKKEVRGRSLVMEKERHDHKDENSDDLKKRLAAREEEVTRLAAELARKNELLKVYEALLAKASSGPVPLVSGN